MSLLPSFMTATVNEQVAANRTIIPKEYDIDFDTGQLTGKIAEGKAAVRVWIWNCLNTQRFRYPIYSWDYGADLEQYIGETVSEGFLNTDCESEITEALMVNPYISGVDDFTAEFKGTRLHISFTAVTTFGNIEVDHYV